jgi:hypothetical protein
MESAFSFENLTSLSGDDEDMYTPKHCFSIGFRLFLAHKRHIYSPNSRHMRSEYMKYMKAMLHGVVSADQEPATPPANK